jgi:uncharacterized protein
MDRRTALITGASSGIGLELARLAANDRNNLVIVGRDPDRLERVAAELRAQYGVDVRPEAKDLSSAAGTAELCADLTKAGIAIDILINNAGVGLYGSLAEQSPEAIDRMVQLNVAALTTLTRFALAGMRARRWGRILNLASVVAYQPGSPYMAVYYATKAYVLAFSRGLSRELDGTGVSVTVLSPGPTQTAFDDRAGAEGPSVLYKRYPKMTAEAVARAGYRGMQRQSRAVIPGLLTKLLAVAGELPPRLIALEINRSLWKSR